MSKHSAQLINNTVVVAVLTDSKGSGISKRTDSNKRNITLSYL